MLLCFMPNSRRPCDESRRFCGVRCVNWAVRTALCFLRHLSTELTRWIAVSAWSFLGSVTSALLNFAERQPETMAAAWAGREPTGRLAVTWPAHSCPRGCPDLCPGTWHGLLPKLSSPTSFCFFPLTVRVFTARHYASAVHAVVACPSVRPSVCH